MNEAGGGRPGLLFKLRSGVGVCTAVLCNCTESWTALNRNYTSGSRGFNDRAPHREPPPRLVAASRATDKTNHQIKLMRWRSHRKRIITVVISDTVPTI